MASHPSVCHGRIAPDCWPFLAQHDPCDPWCSERKKWRGKRWCSVWPFWWKPQGGESPIQPCHPENSASPLFDIADMIMGSEDSWRAGEFQGQKRRQGLQGWGVDTGGFGLTLGLLKCQTLRAPMAYGIAAYLGLFEAGGFSWGESDYSPLVISFAKWLGSLKGGFALVVTKRTYNHGTNDG